MEKVEDILKRTIDEIFEYIDIEPSVSIFSETDGDSTYSKVVIDGKNLSFLIGYRGESLMGLQNYLALVLFNQTNDWHRIIVDINGYKDSRQEKLEDIARHAIDKVRFFREEVEMHPMSSYERRILHTFISGYDDITTESIGEGRDRRVIIKPKSFS